MQYQRWKTIEATRKIINPICLISCPSVATSKFLNILPIDAIPAIENNEFHIDIFDFNVFRDNNLNNIRLLNLF
jgi:hypothetical protein